MLRQLHIENYTLIDSLDLEFHPGFNLLTGETGSGKSIVVDAVELLLGGRASPEVIRSGCERAQIAGVFSAPVAKAASALWNRMRALLDESGITLDAGEDLILQREILAGGKSRAFVNHCPATAGLLKNLAPFLAEVHGQNEQQELFSPAAQLEMLDRFGGLTPKAVVVREQFVTWKGLREQKDNLARRQQERLRQMDIWQFQKREIEQAAITQGEDAVLEQEKRLLVHGARIQSSLAAAFDQLYDSSNSAAALVSAAARNLESISAVDESLQPALDLLLSAKVSIEDAALSLRDRLAHLDMSPQRLEEVENRLAQLERLKRKYGPALENVSEYYDQVCADLREAESAEALGSALEDQLRAAAKAYAQSAGELSSQRREAAQELKREIERELKALAMNGTVFETRLTGPASGGEPSPEWSASGIDHVEFLISPNPGEPLRPLNRIASGGEISRIMLAVELVTDSKRGAAGRDHTLVFDEIDAGIGGRAAETVGKKLRQLGEHRQVLCVTHLPQIASFAHHHLRVQKVERGGRTVTRVDYLRDGERTEELARMLSGSRITDAVIKHAEQLLKANS